MKAVAQKALQKKTPYPYQEDAIRALIEHAKTGNTRALLAMATGLGKTFVAFCFVRWWFETFGGNCLFLIDRTDPLEKTEEEGLEVLGDLGIRTAMWHTNRKDHPSSGHVFLTTFQSMEGMRTKFRPDSFDVVIVDEAHHGHARTYRETIEYFTPKFLMGMTATPDRMDRKDIREIFGDEVYTLMLAQALREGLLAKVVYNVVSDNLNISALRKLAKQVAGGDRRVSRRQINDTIFLRERDEKIVEKVHAEQPGRKAIYFCNSIEHVQAIHAHAVHAAPYHSKRNPGELKRTFADFRDGSLQEVLVVDKFNEAVDIPSAEVLVFVRATDSLTVWLQQLGRGLRDPTKTVYVYDFVANCDRVMWVAELGRQIGVGLGIEKPDALHVSGISIHFTDELRDLLDLLQSLEQGPWVYRYGQLKEFKEKHGHCNVPLRWKENSQLGSWVHKQRHVRKQGRLPSDRISQLDELGFVWDSHEAAWQEQYEQLKEFKEKYGHCNVPFKWEQNQPLRVWTDTQRQFKRQGLLSDDRVAKLDELGFVWDLREATWQEQYAALKEFKAKYGHCNVPSDWKEDPQLAVWVATNRRFRRNGKLSDDRVAKLDELGFVWDLREATWQEQYAALKEFKAKYGHCNVPVGWNQDKQLAVWTCTQRQFKRQGLLSDDRIAKLDELGFDWNPSPGRKPRHLQPVAPATQAPSSPEE